MPITSKVLVPLIAVVSLAFIWLATVVLQTRQNWDTKVKAKAAEIAKVTEEIDLLARGDDGAREMFREFVKTEVRPLGSEEFRKIYHDQVTANEALPTFMVAMDSFVDAKVLAAYRQAVEKLNELQKTPVVEETDLVRLLRDYDAAERDLEQQFKNLDTAYALFLGEVPSTSGGIRAIGERKVDGVYKGLGIETVRNALLRVGQIILQQQAIFRTVLSDGQKNETLARDKVDSTRDQASQLQKAATGAELESEERKKEVEDETVRHAKEKIMLAEWEAKRDKSIAEMTALLKRLDDTTAKCVRLAKIVRETEIRIDQRRGILTAVLSPDGTTPTGKVQSVDEKTGMIRVNLGVNNGVRKDVQLQVYRKNPKAKYLGILVISDANSDNSSGRMLPEFRQLAIKVGDSVTTEIRPEGTQ